MKLTIRNLNRIKELCKCNPNEVITIDDVNYCWIFEEMIAKNENDGIFRIELANGWETLYI